MLIRALITLLTTISPTDQNTPDQVYKSGQGDGALIVDKPIKEGAGPWVNEKLG